MGPRFGLLLSLVAQDAIAMDSPTGLFGFIIVWPSVAMCCSINFRLHLGLLYDRAFQDRWVGN